MEIKVFCNNKNSREEITQFVTQLTWSGSANEATRSLEFGMVNSPFDSAMDPPVLAMGSIIEFYGNGKLLFYGRVLNREKIGEKGELNYTARDLMNNLIKSRMTKKFKKKTPEYIAKACAKMAGLEVGSLYKTKMKIKKQYATEESCYNILMNAYAKAAAKKHIQFFPRMNGAKLEIIRKGNIVATLDQDADITALRITTNAEDMVNRVNIYSQKGKKTGQVQKANWVKAFGVFQEVLTKEEKSSGKKQAKALLKGQTQSMEIDAIGNIACIAGAGVYVYDALSDVTGNFWIESDSHTFSNGIHKMSLQMAFKNVTENPDVNYDSGSGSRSGSGSKYVSTGVMVGRKVTGLRFTAYVKGEGGPNDMRGRPLNPADKTVAFDWALHTYGRAAYGMKMQIFGTKTRYDKKIMTIRDTGTGNNHTVDILMTKAQENRWNNPHGYVIIAKTAKFKKKKVRSGSSGAGGGKADKLIRFAKKYKGKVRYNLGSDNVPGGVSDCSAFVRFEFRKSLGISLPRVTYEQVKKGKAIKKASQLQPGDLVFFNNVGHVGIYSGAGKFIHCGCSHGVWINTLKSGHYRQAFCGGRRII